MKLSLIVPCYNEEDVLRMFYTEVLKVMDSEDYDYELIFVDDGSRDNTLNILIKLAEENPRVKYLSFARNFGKESAMLAGMKYAQGEYIGILDADLQHPPKAIIKMVDALDEGYDIAAARRKDRVGETKLKSYFSERFYKIINKLADIDIQDGAQDFRVMKRKVVKSIVNMPEYHRFSKGIFSWVGFKTKWFEHENVERPVGVSKWSFFKLCKYAIDGIVAFSTVPLKLSLIFGTVASMVGFVYAVYIIIKTLLIGIDTPGYASIMAGILIMGGIILICIGILGEYISRIYIEVKHRPIYIIDETNVTNVYDEINRENECERKYR